MTPNLVFPTWSLPASRAPADAAREAGWTACAIDETPHPTIRRKVVFYGGTDVARAVAARFHLALLEPPFDLLTKVPMRFRLRAVEYARFGDLARLKAPAFVKPADALNKSFDAGIYASPRDIRWAKAVDARCPVLVAEPVEWSAEYRCFIREGEIAAWSPYLSFGRPAWKPFGPGTLANETPAILSSFCARLFRGADIRFPPAFVVDVGLIDDRGWSVVELNRRGVPACSAPTLGRSFPSSTGRVRIYAA